MNSLIRKRRAGFTNTAQMPSSGELCKRDAWRMPGHFFLSVILSNAALIQFPTNQGHQLADYPNIARILWEVFQGSNQMVLKGNLKVQGGSGTAG